MRRIAYLGQSSTPEGPLNKTTTSAGLHSYGHAKSADALNVRKQPKASTSFYDFDQYERLVAAANVTDVRAYVLVLLGGEAGLRLGEMVALEWRDIDLVKRQLCVARSSWKEQVATPKGRRLRYVPLTVRLAIALRDNRHLRGPRVLYQDDGRPLTRRRCKRSCCARRDERA